MESQSVAFTHIAKVNNLNPGQVRQTTQTKLKNSSPVKRSYTGQTWFKSCLQSNKASEKMFNLNLVTQILWELFQFDLKIKISSAKKLATCTQPWARVFKSKLAKQLPCVNKTSAREGEKETTNDRTSRWNNPAEPILEQKSLIQPVKNTLPRLTEAGIAQHQTVKTHTQNQPVTSNSLLSYEDNWWVDESRDAVATSRGMWWLWFIHSEWRGSNHVTVGIALAFQWQSWHYHFLRWQDQIHSCMSCVAYPGHYLRWSKRPRFSGLDNNYIEQITSGLIQDCILSKCEYI